MNLARKTTLAAALALTATAGLALPASAEVVHHSSRHHMMMHRHHAAIRHNAYRVGYNQGFRDGHYAAATGEVPGAVVTGRSVAVDPAYRRAGDPGLAGNGGLLGLGILGGNGLLGTGVLDGQGALGIGVLGL